MKFCDNFRELRRQRDLSQEAVADVFEVSRQTISKWENGQAMPDLKKLTDIANYFDVSMDFLLGTKIDEDSTEDQAQNINNVLLDELTRENKEHKKKSKALSAAVIILSVALVITNIVFASNNSRLNNEISNLYNRISIISNNQGTVVYDDNEDDSSYTSDASVEFLGYDDTNSGLAGVRLVYSPVKYDKNQKVSFVMKAQNEKSQSVDATLQDGEFVATAKIDLSKPVDLSVVVEKDDLVESFYLGNGFSVLNLIEINAPLTVTTQIFKPSDDGVSPNDYCVYDEENKISWHTNSKIKIVRAEIVARYGDKDDTALEHTIKANNDFSYIIPKAIKIKGTVNSFALRLTDEDGIKYEKTILSNADYEDEVSVMFPNGSSGTFYER